MSLSEKIKKLRKGMKLSQERLAELAGINANHLSRLERGLFQPSADVLKRLAQVLNISADYLLSERDEVQTPEVKIENKTLAERLELIERLDPTDQQVIIRVIDSMLTQQRMRELLAHQSAQTASPLNR
ncbi:MAG TPA: helix-turn-helix transcriptional regulator [Acidobacteriota bacterium]|nr:helix-turn-helix transcriptional regulator [Acidobacteriota bacterium]